MQNTLLQSTRAGAVLLVAFTVLTGLLYPAAVTGFAQFFFAEKASGGLIARQGNIIGSNTIGQDFAQAKYFWPRPSVNGAPSNLAPGNPTLATQIAVRGEKLVEAHGNTRPPVELLTASASGLDPHISVGAAYYQAERVARARGWAEKKVRGMVDALTETSLFDLGAPPRVNVLKLNLALDGAPQPAVE